MQTEAALEQKVAGDSAAATKWLKTPDASLKGSGILIIDDQLGVVEVLRKVLEQDGYLRIESTTDPLDAIRLFGEFQPDLVVLDLVMPALSGWKVLAGLRAVMSTDMPVPIIVVTSDRTGATRRDAFALGASDFVTKPFDRTEILSRIRTSLEVRSNVLLAEKARRESEERFSTAFEQAPIGMALVAVGGRCLRVNRTLCRLAGYSEADLLTRTIGDITHPDDLEATLQQVSRMMSGEIPSFQIKKRLIHGGGHRVTVLASVSLVRDGQGQASYSIAHIQDITEREQSEKEMGWKTAFLEAQVHSSPDGMLVVDERGKRLLQNQRFTDLLKIPKHLAEDEETRDQIRWVASQTADPARYGARVAELNAHPHEVGRDEIELKDGTVLDHSSVPVIGKEGLYYGRIWLLRDITARKRAEEELVRSQETLQDILNNIPQRVYWKDRDSVYLGCNQSFAADIGMSDPGAIRGKTDFDGRWRTVAETYRSNDREVIERDEAKIGIEAPSIGANGDSIWFRTNKIPLHDQEGRVIGVLGTYEDITEHKLARLEIERLNVDLERRVTQRTEQLFAATQEAERANRAKSEFLSRTSHELRTPLNAILGFSQLLAVEDNLGAEARDNVEQILSAGRHLLAMVNEVLSISNADTGAMTLSLEPLAVRDVVEETMCLARPLAAAQRINLEHASALEGNLSVFADHQRLIRVLATLLSGAVEYSRTGGTVVLKCARSPVSGPPMVRFSVQDTGPGISREDLDRIFNPFDRPDPERNQTHNMESGLGLAAAKRTVELMGGRIGVTSTPDVGRTFWVELPLSTDPVAPTPQGSPGLLVDLQPKVLERTTILYLAADFFHLRLITRMLARRPAIHLLSVQTGDLAMEMAGAQRVDLILLDLDFPDGGGERELARLRVDARTCDIPVMILSADCSGARREQLLNAGAHAFLTKPLEVRALLAALDQLLVGNPE